MAPLIDENAPVREVTMRENRHSPVERITDTLETPSLDDRSYRVIKLPNQLEVLLVHDPETDKASAAMDVNVGSFSDNEDMPGLAHSLEHMLFMGTKKYPKENAYAQYLSANSGNSNAYTASTSTNYFFELAASANESADSSDPEASPLHGALDRFAQFFIEPLFLSSTLDRELLAVDSENKKNLQNDQWRLHQLDKSLSNPKHPYCHFSTGNLETLKSRPEARGVDIRKEFMDFHDKHYSANIMKLVVLGREPLDTLERWVAELFAGIENKNLPKKRWDGAQPFEEDELLTQIFAKPVMESRSLDLTFPWINEEDLYEVQPGRYWSHLLGHEGPGSVMSYIKSKGWANGLSAGGYFVCPGTSMFSLTIRLTADGLKNYREVVKVIFQYIAMLRETKPQEWIFKELQAMAEIDFRFKQKSRAGSFTTHVASVMQKPLPREYLLSGSSRVRKFDPVLIREALEFLRPDNFRMTIVSQEYPGDWNEREKWYGTEYKYEKIPQDFVEEVKRVFSSSPKEKMLHLPHKNEFIPSKLEVEKKDIKEPAVSPTLLRNDEQIRAWYKKDDTFWVPKANLFINCRNPLPSATAENSMKTKIYTELVRDALEEYSYDAELAGLSFGVSNYTGGLSIELSGYTDKIHVLLEKVLVTMRDLEIDSDRFSIIKERFERNLRNFEYQQPYNQIGSYSRWLTSEDGFIPLHYLQEIPQITAEDIRVFYPQLLKQMHIESFAHGNLYKEDALRLTDLLSNTLSPRTLPQAHWPIRRNLIFPPGAKFVYHKTLNDPANVNHCIEYLLHIGDKADRVLRAKLLLLAQMTDEPAFDQLRTKEQLGYVVFSGSRMGATTMQYRVIIQSERTPEYLQSRIESFLTGFRKIFEGMSEADFEGHKRSLITKRLEKMKNLDQESSRIWSHIDSEYFDFELVHHDAAHVKPLTKVDMAKFFDHYISPASPNRSTLAIHLHAQGKAPVAEGTAIEKAAAIESEPQSLAEMQKNEAVVIEDVRDFKARLAVSAGARAVKDLTEFEDLDSKL